MSPPVTRKRCTACWARRTALRRPFRARISARAIQGALADIVRDGRFGSDFRFNQSVLGRGVRGDAGLAQDAAARHRCGRRLSGLSLAFRLPACCLCSSCDFDP